MRCLVTGAGGFIGGHLVRQLLDDHHQVIATDKKPLRDWYQRDERAVTIDFCDLSRQVNAARLFRTAIHAFDRLDEVYLLAADMGGMGFIEANKLDCMLNVLITANVLEEAAHYEVGRVFFSSSACVYPDFLQVDAAVEPLREEHAYPAMPEDGYGWEKLYSERLCRHYTEDRGLETRVARYHNVYGPFTAWQGGREKAPAALCRKVAEAVLANDLSIEVWGDGYQTRSFMFIDDCIEGTLKIMRSAHQDPINLGSTELVTINELIEIVEEVAGVTVERRYDTSAPKGVRGRNSDNTLIRKLFDWEPTISLGLGMGYMYEWVMEQLLLSR